MWRRNLFIVQRNLSSTNRQEYCKELTMHWVVWRRQFKPLTLKRTANFDVKQTFPSAKYCSMQKSLGSINYAIQATKSSDKHFTRAKHRSLIDVWCLCKIFRLEGKYFQKIKSFNFSFFVLFLVFEANYDPAEDEASEKNGHATFANGLDDNNPPITSQPTRLQRNISMNRWFFTQHWGKIVLILNRISLFFSSKIHENDVKREIQTANVNLAPEIVQVFANSQIFHDHKPLKVKPSSPTSPAQPATFTLGTSSPDKARTEAINEEGSRKLLERLDEGNESDNL